MKKFPLLPALVLLVSFTACVKEKAAEETNCKVCEVKNSVGTKIDERTVCSESAESELRSANRNYTVTCR